MQGQQRGFEGGGGYNLASKASKKNLSR